MADSPIPDSMPEELPVGPDEAISPYRNLLVPLVVVPALIIMVLVLVWVLFGAIAGNEATPQENLERMLHSTKNERDQAAMLLVIQVLDSLEAEEEGREPDWQIDGSFLPELQRAWDETDDRDARFRYVLGVLLVRMGDPQGTERLCSLLSIDDELDPDAEVRFTTLFSLGALGPGLSENDRSLAAKNVIPFLTSDDSGLRQMAAAALQSLPGEDTRGALRGALGDGALTVRGNAAISLSHLEDPAGAGVLLELIGTESYAAERALDERLWSRGQEISDSRVKAVHALARLGRAEDLTVLQRLSAGDDDLNVREAALRALRDGEG